MELLEKEISFSYQTWYYNMKRIYDKINNLIKFINHNPKFNYQRPAQKKPERKNYEICLMLMHISNYYGTQY